MEMMKGKAQMTTRSRTTTERDVMLRSGRALWTATGGLLVTAAVSLCALAACALLTAPVALGDEACSNAAFRTGASSGLPDCRAYELVTPPDKDAGEPRAIVPGSYQPTTLPGIEGMQASISGDRLAWSSEYPLPGSPSIGLQYLSSRGPNGWTSENVIPPQSVENGTNCPAIVAMAAYSSDLSRGVLADGYGQPGSFKGEALSCGHDEPRLVPGEPEGFQNLFLRNNDASSYQLVNVTPSGAPAPRPAPGDPQYFPAAFLGGSSDLSHVVFEEELPLTAGAPEGDDLYEWSNGVVHLVSVLPDGTPIANATLASATKDTGFEEATGTFLPVNIANARHAVSRNGSSVFFEAAGDLYVRENAEQPQSPLGVHGECIVSSDACTVQVDASRTAGSGGGGRFMAASEDGSKVFFEDAESAGLTGDTVAGSGENLYEYDVRSGALRDLTGSVGEAKVDGVSGASEDGSYVYLVAEGALAANTTAGRAAVAGQPNLYVLHEGSTRFIATLDTATHQQYGDSCDWMSQECTAYPLPGGVTARVSANGRFIGFDSDKSLTGYDNTGPSCVPIIRSVEELAGFEPGLCEEVFVYDTATGSLNCVSCDPDGATPTGPAMIRFPARASQDLEMRNTYPQRNVSDGGQVFFETPDALVAGDTDGKRDVYEYENGAPFLISNGKGEADSYFLDASVDGSDVFIASAQRLAGSDDDGSYDIYDARMGGGFPEPAGVAPSCEGEGCRGAAGGAPPVFSAPSSMAFSGAGNLSAPVPVRAVVKPKRKPVTCKRGYVKKKGKCVKQRKAKAKKSAKGRK